GIWLATAVAGKAGSYRWGGGRGDGGCGGPRWCNDGCGNGGRRCGIGGQRQRGCGGGGFIAAAVAGKAGSYRWGGGRLHWRGLARQQEAQRAGDQYAGHQPRQRATPPARRRVPLRRRGHGGAGTIGCRLPQRVVDQAHQITFTRRTRTSSRVSWVLPRAPNRRPMPGISDRPGMPLSSVAPFWSIRPPSITVSPSRRFKVVVMPLTLITGRVTALPLGNVCSARLPGTTSVCIGCTSS